MQSRVRHLPLTALATALAASLLAAVPVFERSTFAQMQPAIERNAETAAGQDNVKCSRSLVKGTRLSRPQFRGRMGGDRTDIGKSRSREDLAPSSTEC